MQLVQAGSLTVFIDGLLQSSKAAHLMRVLRVLDLMFVHDIPLQDVQESHILDNLIQVLAHQKKDAEIFYTSLCILLKLTRYAELTDSIVSSGFITYVVDGILFYKTNEDIVSVSLSILERLLLNPNSLQVIFDAKIFDIVTSIQEQYQTSATIGLTISNILLHLSQNAEILRTMVKNSITQFIYSCILCYPNENEILKNDLSLLFIIAEQESYRKYICADEGVEAIYSVILNKSLDHDNLISAVELLNNMIQWKNAVVDIFKSIYNLANVLPIVKDQIVDVHSSHIVLQLLITGFTNGLLASEAIFPLLCTVLFFAEIPDEDLIAALQLLNSLAESDHCQNLFYAKSFATDYLALVNKWQDNKEILLFFITIFNSYFSALLIPTLKDINALETLVSLFISNKENEQIEEQLSIFLAHLVEDRDCCILFATNELMSCISEVMIQYEANDTIQLPLTFVLLRITALSTGADMIVTSNCHLPLVKNMINLNNEEIFNLSCSTVMALCDSPVAINALVENHLIDSIYFILSNSPNKEFCSALINCLKKICTDPKVCSTIAKNGVDIFATAYLNIDVSLHSEFATVFLQLVDYVKDDASYFSTNLSRALLTIASESCDTIGKITQLNQCLQIILSFAKISGIPTYLVQDDMIKLLCSIFKNKITEREICILSLEILNCCILDAQAIQTVIDESQLSIIATSMNVHISHPKIQTLLISIFYHLALFDPIKTYHLSAVTVFSKVFPLCIDDENNSLYTIKALIAILSMSDEVCVQGRKQLVISSGLESLLKVITNYKENGEIVLNALQLILVLCDRDMHRSRLCSSDFFKVIIPNYVDFLSNKEIIIAI